MQQAMEALADTLRQQGAKPYVIPGGGSNPIGALGYVAAAERAAVSVQSAASAYRSYRSCHRQYGNAGRPVGWINRHQQPDPLLGISVRAPREKQEENVYALAQRTWQLLGIDGEIPRHAVQVNSDYVGKGYGIPNQGTLEALTLLAQLEGILLDPVYSGKGMAGLIDLIRKGHFARDQNLVFIHTGGSAGLFGYRQLFEQAAL